MEKLENTIKNICKDEGSEYIGFADISPVRKEVIRQGGEILRPYQTAVVFGLVLQDSIVDMLVQRTEGAKIFYYHHAYQVINTRIDLLTSRIADIIQESGFSALPIPASRRYDNETISSIFSHKLAARQAGFGWIGKSCMLITPEHGPRVRWGTVLTDAPLHAKSEPVQESCGKCRACVDICPVQAYTGEPFREEEPRKIRFDAEKCDQYFEKMKQEGQDPVCGLCLYVCPHGRKKRGN